MIISAKTKKALATIRKELGFSARDMKTMLGDVVTLSMIKDFENNIDSENDFLAICYFDIFHFVTAERSELEEYTYNRLEDVVPVTTNSTFNPFERKNPFKVKTN